MELKIINGDNIDILKTYPDNYFDVVETHHQNRFKGSELVDTIIQSEYSITIEK
jgi:DNA modification methylase